MRKTFEIPLWCLWGQWLLVLSLVLYGLFRPQPPVQLFVPWEDKGQHLMAFAGLMFSSRLLIKRNFLWVTIAGLVMAVAAEVFQPMISPLRLGSVGDAVANVFGVLFGVFFFWIWKRNLKAR